MMLRRSERLNQGQNASGNRTPVKQLINPYSVKRKSTQLKQEKKEVHQGRYFNSPEIQKLITETQNIKKEIQETPEVEEIPQIPKIPEVQTITDEIKTETSPVKNVSATTKALEEEKVKEESNNKKWKKGGKDSAPCPNILYAQELRIEINPNLRNISAVTKALQKVEAKGANNRKKWRGGVKVPMALKRKKLNQRLAKLLAPKNALILLNEFKPGCTYKVIEQTGSVAPSFLAHVEHENNILGTGQGLSKTQAKSCAAENAIKGLVSKAMSKQPTDGNMHQGNIPDDLPWAGLASLAIYKMFSEWQSQGVDIMPINRLPIKQNNKPKNKPNGTSNKKDLPPNATELHPTVLLNMMIPGLIAIEIERESGPKCRVKMGYKIDGQLYLGEGGNKKDARKEAAKSVLQALYGLTYL